MKHLAVIVATLLMSIMPSHAQTHPLSSTLEYATLVGQGKVIGQRVIPGGCAHLKTYKHNGISVCQEYHPNRDEVTILTNTKRVLVARNALVFPEAKKDLLYNYVKLYRTKDQDIVLVDGFFDQR